MKAPHTFMAVARRRPCQRMINIIIDRPYSRKCWVSVMCSNWESGSTFSSQTDRPAGWEAFEEGPVQSKEPLANSIYQTYSTSCWESCGSILTTGDWETPGPSQGATPARRGWESFDVASSPLVRTPKGFSPVSDPDSLGLACRLLYYA